MKAITGPASMLALPSIWRRYQWPLRSPSRSESANLSAPSGKWPQKITALAQTLRMRPATRLAFTVEPKPARGDNAVNAG